MSELSKACKMIEAEMRRQGKKPLHFQAHEIRKAAKKLLTHPDYPKILAEYEEGLNNPAQPIKSE